MSAPSEVRVIRATEAHVPDIVRLVGELRAQEDLPAAIPAESVHAYLAEPACVVLLAEAEDGIVGLLSVRVMGDLFHGGTSALIQELIVDEDRRRTGVAGALLDAAIAHARDAGCAEIAVSTGERNLPARAAYRSRGFEEEGLLLELHLEE